MTARTPRPPRTPRRRPVACGAGGRSGDGRCRGGGHSGTLGALRVRHIGNTISGTYSGSVSSAADLLERRDSTGEGPWEMRGVRAGGGRGPSYRRRRGSRGCRHGDPDDGPGRRRGPRPRALRRALARLGESDPVRTAGGPSWSRPPTRSTAGAPGAPPGTTPRRRSSGSGLARGLAIDHLPERLAIADEAVDLGRRAGTDEYAAWDAGGGWTPSRSSATASTCSRSSRRCSPWSSGWTGRRGAYLTLVDYPRLLEGRWGDARRLADDAVALEGDLMGEAAFFRVVTPSAIAQQTGVASPRAAGGAAGRQAAVLRPRLDLPDVQGHRRGRGRGPLARPSPPMPERAPEWVIATWAVPRSAPGWATSTPTGSSTTSSRRSPATRRPVPGAVRRPRRPRLGRLAACLGDAGAARAHPDRRPAPDRGDARPARAGARAGRARRPRDARSAGRPGPGRPLAMARERLGRATPGR